MSTKNLELKEAREKLKELATDIDFCMMATNLGNKPLSVIPMSTKKVDDNGDIWFLSGADSDHNKDIERSNDVHLIYSKPGSMEFLSVYGKASITKDKQILKDLYGKSDDNWFDGLDDPNLTALQFNPSEAYYWDTKNNKFVTLFKMGVGAITGDQPDIGVSGKLNV